MEYNCFVCSYSNDSNESLIKHLQYVHASLKEYHCLNDTCCRKFSSINSFRKHRFACHSFRKQTESCSDSKMSNNIFCGQKSEQSTSYVTDRHCSSDNATSLEEINGSEREDQNSKPSTISKFQITETGCNATCNLRSFQTNFTNESLYFLSKMYNFNDLPRNRVQNIIDSITNLLQNPTTKLLTDDLMQRLKDLGETPENLNKFSVLFDTLLNPFKNLNSEWLRLKELEKSGTYIPPTTIPIGQRNDFCSEDGKEIMVYKPVTVEVIPIRTVFKTILELPGMLDSIIQYFNYLDENSIVLENLIQGNFWKQKKNSFGDKFVLPLILYFDEYETNNPLGNHRGIAKTGAVYISIACLPPSIQSKLENIFILLLFNTLDEKYQELEVILAKAIEELIYLESQGITVFKGSEQEKHIYFSVATIIGDNLGVNAITGFVSSFSANFCCRFCLMYRDERRKTSDDRLCQLRTRKNYEEHLKEQNVKTTGIKNSCCFHKLPHFNVIDSLAVDVMHDLLEGVCQYDYGKVLYNFIFVKDLFSLDILNSRIRGFYYGPNEKRNKPIEISKIHVKDQCINMSSAEMLCFARNITLLIGDRIPEDDPYWGLVITLKKIIDICTAKIVRKSVIAYLRVLIREYLSSLLSLFPDCLKFKHHILLHYADVLATFGPLWNICSINFERKHRESKISTYVSINRKNITHSCGIKNQLKLNFQLRKEQFNEIFTTGPLSSLDNLKNLDNYYSFSPLLPLITDNISMTKYILYMGNEIREGAVLMMASEDGPSFFYVHVILIESTNNVIIVTSCIEDFTFDDHFQAYEVEELQEQNWRIIQLSELKFCTVVRIVKIANKKTYIPKRWI